MEGKECGKVRVKSFSVLKLKQCNIICVRVCVCVCMDMFLCVSVYAGQSEHHTGVKPLCFVIREINLCS